MSDIPHDTLQLAKALIACRSITPADEGAVAMLATRLSAAGFRCERLDRGSVSNLWARYGDSGPLVCLAGHVDVVPPGPVGEWTSDPFTPTERDGELYGRGAADMKSSVAAMVTAAERVVRAGSGGSIAILLTSDEEGDAVDGTAAGDAFTACLLVSLLEGWSEPEALTRACAAGAVAASRFGAQPSLPTAAEVNAILGG